jgi:hypothetical protein
MKNENAMLWYWRKDGTDKRSAEEIIQPAVTYFEKKYSRKAAGVIVASCDVPVMKTFAGGTLPLFESKSLLPGHLIVASDLDQFNHGFKQVVENFD